MAFWAGTLHQVISGEPWLRLGLLQELFDRCESKRRTLFKLASETEDNDSSLGEWKGKTG